MIYGNVMRESVQNKPAIDSPYELLEISANYQFDFASILSEAVEMDILTESVSPTAIITLLIKLLKKFGVIIAGVVAAFIAFIAKKNGEINKEKSGSSSGNGFAGRYNIIEDGIAHKDLRKLRSAVGSICYLSRDFSSGEFDEALEYLKSRGIDINEEFSGDPPLISSQKSTFTDDDFETAVFELKENFCDERIKDVKTIGKWLYGSGKAKSKEKEKDTISIEYKNWQDLLEDRVIIDGGVIKEFREIVQFYTEYAEKFNAKLDSLSKEDVTNMDHSNTNDQLKAFVDPFRDKFNDKFENIKKSSCKIISGGKDNYFGNHLGKFVSNGSFGNVKDVADICRSIRGYRDKVKTKQFTTTHTTWKTDFDKEFESVDKLVKEYTDVLRKRNDEIQSEIKTMVSKLNKLEKQLDSNYRKFSDIGIPKDQNMRDKYYKGNLGPDVPASKMHGNVRPAAGSIIRNNINLLIWPLSPIRNLLSDIGKIMNCSVTEVSSCASQMVAEKARVLKRLSSTKS